MNKDILLNRGVSADRPTRLSSSKIVVGGLIVAGAIIELLNPGAISSFTKQLKADAIPDAGNGPSIGVDQNISNRAQKFRYLLDKPHEAPPARQVLPLEEFEKTHPDFDFKFHADPNLSFTLVGISKENGEKLLEQLGDKIKDTGFELILADRKNPEGRFDGFTVVNSEKIVNGKRILVIKINIPNRDDMNGVSRQYTSEDVINRIDTYTVKGMIGDSYRLSGIPRVFVIASTRTN